MFITFVLVSGLLATALIFVISIPVNNSIETAADGVSTIFNGAVVLAGGLIAYKIGGIFHRRCY